jgi:hypothetical protein
MGTSDSAFVGGSSPRPESQADLAPVRTDNQVDGGRPSDTTDELAQPDVLSPKDTIFSLLEESPYLKAVIEALENFGLKFEPESNLFAEILRILNLIDSYILISIVLMSSSFVFSILSHEKIFSYFMDKFPFPNLKPWVGKIMSVRRASNTLWRYVILISVLVILYNIHLLSFVSIGLLNLALKWLE